MFIARENEMRLLRQIAESDHFELLVMYGRRRVGKTELLNQLSKEYKTLFYSAQEKNDAMNFDSFSKKVKEYFNMNEGIQFSTWEVLFNIIGEQADTMILIIDEFPFLALENPSLMSILQHVIDHNWSKKKIKLILCGSSISFMEKEVLAYKSPLYGRRTYSMEVRPFDYYDSSLFTKNVDSITKSLIYGILGGVPKYLSLYDEKKDFEFNLKELILKPNSYLYNEPNYLLRTELRETSVYNSILEAIALGNSKLSEISGHIHEDTSKTSKYLNVLDQLKIVERIVPATEDIHKSKKSLYQFQDNFFKFWYRFVFPNTQTLELFGEEAVFPKIIEQLNSYMGLVFEKMCSDYLIREVRKGKMPFIPEKMGKWWGMNPYRKENNKPVVDDIDILLLSKECVMLCECKYTNELFKYKDYLALKEISGLFHQEKKYFTLFAKTGFDERIINEVKNNNMIRLITLDELYKQ